MGSANGCVKMQNEQSQYKSSLDEKSYIYKGVLLKAAYPHLEPYLESIMNAPKFRFWIDKFDFNAMEFREFTITDVDFFGPAQPERLGFYKGFGTVINKKTKDLLPAIAFNRGECVACLIVVTVKETGEKVIVLCEQLRFAGGKHMIEIPAGMKDSRTHSLKGPVLDEIREETGIVVNEDDPKLVKLGSKIYPSPGGCDEAIDLWLYETEISIEKLREMETNTFGTGEYERIKIKLVDTKDFDELLDKIGDVKAECAWRRYKNLIAKRLENEQICFKEIKFK